MKILRYLCTYKNQDIDTQKINPITLLRYYEQFEI